MTIKNNNRPQDGDHQITTFDHPEFGALRVLTTEGALWFVGKEVAAILGYSNTRDALLKFCKGGSKTRLPSESGNQDYTIIPESDLYRLVMRSKLPAAEKFQDWVCEEVLPSIRKTGRYDILDKPQKSEDEIVLEALQIQQKKIAIAEAKIKELTPKAQFCDAVSDSPDLLSFTQVAKWLKMKSAQELCKWLHAAGIIYKQSKTWLPYAKYSQLSYFKMITHVEQIDGESRTFQHTKVTQAGREFIARKWNESAKMNQIEHHQN